MQLTCFIESPVRYRRFVAEAATQYLDPFGVSNRALDWKEPAPEQDGLRFGL
ncbi:hypothetical protein GCM10007359_08490 [Rothia aerolata]|uniref:Uncharacterized protein n=1 Tax=Rothia aerolata TaxID=1812262 RepID=A0A917ISF4_9MICC|nr:hypothetical protein GCM10007359_08490 [Rothia aerolata]